MASTRDEVKSALDESCPSEANKNFRQTFTDRVGAHNMDGHPALLHLPAVHMRPWDDLIPYEDLSEDNLPPFFVRLRTDQAYALKEWAKSKREGVLTKGKLFVYWPYEFTSEGRLREGRVNWGPRCTANGYGKTVDGEPSHDPLPLPLTYTSSGRVMYRDLEREGLKAKNQGAKEPGWQSRESFEEANSENHAGGPASFGYVKNEQNQRESTGLNIKTEARFPNFNDQSQKGGENDNNNNKNNNNNNNKRKREYEKDDRPEKKARILSAKDLNDCLEGYELTSTTSIHLLPKETVISMAEGLISTLKKYRTLFDQQLDCSKVDYDNIYTEWEKHVDKKLQEETLLHQEETDRQDTEISLLNSTVDALKKEKGDLSAKYTDLRGHTRAVEAEQGELKRKLLAKNDEYKKLSHHNNDIRQGLDDFYKAQQSLYQKLEHPGEAMPGPIVDDLD